MSIREEILDEIEAIRCVYDENRVELDLRAEPGFEASGRISVELEPLMEPSTVSASCNGVIRSISINVLSPISLRFRLSATYPDDCPEIELEAVWLDASMESCLRRKILEVCQENSGLPILFFCCQCLVDEVKANEQKLLTINLDECIYAKTHGTSGAKLLSLLSDASDTLMQNNFESGCYDCEVCFENKSGRDCVRFTPCSHVFCSECVSSYYQEKISQQIRQLECLSDSCESVATQSVVRQAIGDIEFERYERLLLERALGNMSDVVCCARKSCQKPVVIDSGNPLLGRCDHCEFVFCVRCNRTYHGVNPCRFRIEDKTKLVEEYENGSPAQLELLAGRFGGRDNLRRIVEMLKSETWIERKSKPCPKCCAAIEKIDGCNKMHCTKCDTFFCWLCAARLDKNNPYGHFNDGGGCLNRLFEGVNNVDDDDDDFWDNAFDVAFDDGSSSSESEEDDSASEVSTDDLAFSSSDSENEANPDEEGIGPENAAEENPKEDGEMRAVQVDPAALGI